MLRSSLYYWRMNLAVLLAAAVACAVLTGALLVGDSVKGSLRALTLDRLGNIENAVISQALFREKLASEIQNSDRFQRIFSSAVPALMLNGSAVQPDSRQRASRVQIIGIDPKFVDLFAFPDENARNEISEALVRKPDQTLPSVVINESLAKELNTTAGNPIVFVFPKESYVPSESVLGYKDPSEFIRTLRLLVTHVIPDEGVGRFGLSSNQQLPLNAFILLPVLQKAVDQNGMVNSLFLSAETGRAISNASSEIQAILSRSLDLQDLGVLIEESEEYFTIESREVILKDPISQLSRRIGAEMNLSEEPILTYLANRISGNQRAVPYSTITALDLPAPEIFGQLKWKDGGRVMDLKENEIVLNEWTAEDLDVKPGDMIGIEYFVAGMGNQLVTQHHEFVLKGISAMEGLGLDQKLTPEYPGIGDAVHISDWAPPFPIDLSRIRPKDEKYWDEFRAAPKGFVSLKAGQRLWKSRFGDLTSIRMAPPAGTSVRECVVRFREQFLRNVNSQEFGFAFQPVKELGLNAASGSTDFSGLFIGFSCFLIISAALLVALLFRLGVELRSAELGILLSVGYPVHKVLRRFLTEGVFIALLGSLLGLCGSVAYAWFLLIGLKTWWQAAIGSAFLSLHVSPASLLIGFLISMVIVSLSIWRSVSRLSRIPPPILLSGSGSGLVTTGTSRVARGLAFLSLFIVLGLLIYAFASGKSASPAIFFLIGSFCLIAGLAFFSVWLRSPDKKTIVGNGASALFRMALRNCIRNPGRSSLSAGLICSACFIIIAVSANRAQPETDVETLNSGTGGYSLMAESDVAVVQNLNDREARQIIGFPDPDAEMPYRVASFRVLPGDDVSCLNLYRPQKPRILGVPVGQIIRDGFIFSDTLALTKEEKANPWLLLNRPIEAGVIPAIGDANSVNWILHLGLGKEMEITDGLGKPLRLRLVGLLKGSIFQSELLISDRDFIKHFPDQSGYSYFLVETGRGKQTAVAKMLESSLSDFGFDVMSTSEKLASYQVVENTYLSTFQTLGGLGLLLGTVGLSLILIRNVVERRGELATLRAFGYRSSTLALLVLTENGILLLCGILIGAFSAAIAVAPHLVQAGAGIPWFSLMLTLGLVWVTGMAATTIATRFALRIPLIPALKAE